MAHLYPVVSIIALGLFCPALSQAQIALDAMELSYVQDFNSLATNGSSASLPVGWYLSETGSSSDGLYTAGTGSLMTGDVYSFGARASTERALGSLVSNSLFPTFGACFRNNTGAIIHRLDISCRSEQWRLGATGRYDRTDCQYSLDATSLTTGIWIDLDSLDLVSLQTSGTTGAKDGNAPEYRSNLSGSITGISIAVDSTFWLRWSDEKIGGNNDGLAVDDFAILPVHLPESGGRILVAGLAWLSIARRFRRSP